MAVERASDEAKEKWLGQDPGRRQGVGMRLIRLTVRKKTEPNGTRDEGRKYHGWYCRLADLDATLPRARRPQSQGGGRRAEDASVIRCPLGQHLDDWSGYASHRFHLVRQGPLSQDTQRSSSP